MKLFSKKFWDKFGKDKVVLDKTYKLLYKDLKRTNVWWNFRSDGSKSAWIIMNTWNDGRKVSSDDRFWAVDFLYEQLGLSVESHKKLGYDQIVERVRDWVNRVARYTSDYNKYGKREFWSCPYNTFKEIEENGFFEDDCENYALAMCEACVLLGVPEERCLVRAGDFKKRNGEVFGHGTFWYASELWNDWFAVEGSAYASDMKKAFNKVPARNLRFYVDDWFFMNRSRSYMVK